MLLTWAEDLVNLAGSYVGKVKHSWSRCSRAVGSSLLWHRRTLALSLDLDLDLSLVVQIFGVLGLRLCKVLCLWCLQPIAMGKRREAVRYLRCSFRRLNLLRRL